MLILSSSMNKALNMHFLSGFKSQFKCYDQGPPLFQPNILIKLVQLHPNIFPIHAAVLSSYKFIYKMWWWKVEADNRKEGSTERLKHCKSNSEREVDMETECYGLACL